MNHSKDIDKEATSIRIARLRVIRSARWGLLNDRQLKVILDKLKEFNQEHEEGVLRGIKDIT